MMLWEPKCWLKSQLSLTKTEPGSGNVDVSRVWPGFATEAGAEPSLRAKNQTEMSASVRCITKNPPPF
jgi:hypothetical protein